MFKLNWTERADANYKILAKNAAAKSATKKRVKSTKNEGIFKQVKKTVALLQSNPKHPGLQSHEYKSLENPYFPNGKVFVAYAQNQSPGAYRVFWCYGPASREITIIDITPHP